MSNSIFKIMFNFKTAGEIWTAIYSIITLFVLLVALWPIIKENTHKLRTSIIYRHKILFELLNIHESYFGKILSQLDKFKQQKNIPFRMPPTDLRFFDVIEDTFEKITHLGDDEKTQTAQILYIYKKATYRQQNGDHYIMSFDVLRIEFLVASLIKIINIRLKHITSLDQIRNNSYSNIINAAKLIARSYPQYVDLVQFLYSHDQEKK